MCKYGLCYRFTLRFNSRAETYTLLKILDQVSISYAIVNSIVSSGLLKPLAVKGIPSVILIHEFQAYTRPSYIIPRAIKWAGHSVFSARIVLEDALSVIPETDKDRLSIIPQGRCVICRNDLVTNEEHLRISKFMRPVGIHPSTKLLLGWGLFNYGKE